MKFKKHFITAALSILIVSPASQADYSYEKLNDPIPDAGFNVSGINDSGQVVGSAQDNSNSYHSYTYKNGSYTNIDDPSAQPGTTIANGINAGGEVVGSISDANGQQVFLYNGTSYTTLDAIDKSHHDSAFNVFITEATGINASGQIVGNFNNQVADHGFLYSAGNYTMLDDPYATRSLFGLSTYAQGINDSGQVAGYFFNNTGAHGFVFSSIDNTYTTLDDPYGAVGTTIAMGINNAGQVVGSFFSADGTHHGFLYSDGVYSTIDAPGALSTEITGINNKGQLAGSINNVVAGSFNAQNGGAFIATPAAVPVPPAIWLFGSAITGLLGFTRRKSPKQDGLEASSCAV